MEHGEPPSIQCVPARLARALPRVDFTQARAHDLVPALVLGATVFAGLAGIVSVALAFKAELWLGFAALAVVPFLVLGVAALASVLGEVALAVLRMHRDLAGIAARLPHLEATMDEVADEIPRLGFLKLRAGGRARG